MGIDIVFRVKKFPYLTETFIVSNVVEAIRQGYEIKIIANQIYPLQYGTQKEIVEELALMDNVVLNPLLKEHHKLKRYLIALRLLFNFTLLFYFIKYCWFKKRISFSYLFIIKFYSSFKAVKLFHIHFADAGEDVSILKSIGFFNPKIITTFHGIDAHFFDTKEQLEKIKLYSKFYNVWDKITVNTPFLESKLLELGVSKEKIQVIPMGVDKDFYRSKIMPKRLSNSATFKLISIGRLMLLKGHVYGVKSVKLLVDKGYDIHYTIVGDGELKASLKALVKDLSLEKNVTLYGTAEQAVVKNLLEESQLFLMTSIKDKTGREETQGLVTAEAQAMGLPVVGFISGGIPYTVSTDTSILVPQKDYKSLSEAIEKILLDKDGYVTKSESARKLIEEKFSLTYMVEQLYRDLI